MDQLMHQRIKNISFEEVGEKRENHQEKRKKKKKKKKRGGIAALISSPHHDLVDDHENEERNNCIFCREPHVLSSCSCIVSSTSVLQHPPSNGCWIGSSSFLGNDRIFAVPLHKGG